MKNGAFVVFKKELARFFGDKRLLFTTIIMPGLLIFVIYTVMGNAMNSMLDESASVYEIAAVNMPEQLYQSFSDESYNFTEVNLSELDKIKEELSEKKYDLCVVFPENFREELIEYNSTAYRESIPNVEIYYYSASIASSNAYSSFCGILDNIEEHVSNVFNINFVQSEDDINKYDVATEAETSGTLFSMFLPMLLMTLMYSSCASLAPESIAGEKERGTIATMLITPVPRNQIILGKIFALSVMALLSGLSSFLGTFLSMPALLGEMNETVGGLSGEYYMFTDYLWLIVVILSTVMLFVTVISILSAAAKTVKEASTLVMPIMIIVTIISFASMYSTGAKEEFYWYLIPVYNSVQSMIGIFSFNLQPVNLVTTILSNVLYSAVGLFILTKLFNNENVMFGK